jgi:hypothetical protein
LSSEACGARPVRSAPEISAEIDRQGKIRFVQVGEGRYAETEREVETLLGEL